jgi:VCBS repeat-containing protein
MRKASNASGSPVVPSRQQSDLSRFLALEQRVLLDAAALETALAVDASVDAATPEEVPEIAGLFASGDVVVSPLPGSGGASEILFIDSGVEGYENLIGNLGPGVEVHVLQSGRWAEQVQSVLGRRDGDVSAIHLVSHGSSGRLVIGGEGVDVDGLEAHARVWSVMRQALTAEGDFLIYGCDVGAGDAGADFLRVLAEKTGADVAASDDLTGVATLGGDWDLEVAAGDIDASSLFAGDAGAAFSGVLVDGWDQDTEVNSANAATSVAITRTTDNKDFKFVGRAAGNAVDIYQRTTPGGNGNWTLIGTVTGTGGFGTDIAAAGNKLVVSAPTYDNGNNDGRVYVYTWNGTNWTTGVQTIAHFSARYSGRTGYNGGSTDVNDSRGAQEQFGFSVDIAHDGAGNYRLIIGSPYEDWWQYDNDDNDGAWGGSSQTRYERDDVGVAFVVAATGHGNFGVDTTGWTNIIQIESQTDNGTMDAHYFGSVVAVGYDQDSTNWWYAVGGEGDTLNEVRTYDAPGYVRVVNGAQTNTFAYTGTGRNAVSMDDDYLVIANSGSMQAYKVNAGSTSFAAIGSAFGGGNSHVAIDDWDQSAAGDTTHGGSIYASDSAGSAVYQVNSSGQFVGIGSVNAVAEAAVAIDKYYNGIDLLSASGTGTRSYHYNWDPDTVADAVTVSEDGSNSVNVVVNDTDINITTYGASGLNVTHGDSLSVSAVGASAFSGVVVSYAGNNVTYNASGSAYLQTLAVGQSVSETVTVTVTDGQGGFETSNLVVTINGVNDAPVANALTPLTPYAYQQSGSTAVYDFSAFFDDVDTGEDAQLSPSATALPPGWSAVTDGIYLRVTIPTSETAGNKTITVRVQDPQGLYSATKNFIINVDTVNNAPTVAVPIADQVALAGQEYSFTVPTTTFNDPDPLPYDTLTYTATLSSGAALPAWLTFDSATRTFSGSPAAGDVGVITVRVRATDDAASKGRGANLSVFDDYQIVVVNPAEKTFSEFTNGPATNADFGFSVAISENGNALVVGAPGNNSIWIYNWNGSTWAFVAGINGPVANSLFGYSIDLSTDGLRMIVGARGEQIGADIGRGAAYCYDRASTGVTFTQRGKIIAAGGTANDYFGTSVAINEGGGFVAIGASHYDYDTDGGGPLDPLSDSGAAWMVGFQGTAGTYTFSPNVLPKDPTSFDRFGTSVAFDENIVVVAAVGDDNANGMVSRLAFDDASGLTAAATFGAVTGTLDAEAQFIDDGTRGRVLNLTGANGKVTLAGAGVDLGANWTISTWYKGLRAVGAAEWRTLTRGTNDHQIIVNDTGLLGVYDNAGGSGFVSSGYDMDVLNNSLWHHIVAVGEGTTTTFYIDGVKVGSAVAEKPTDDIIAVGNFQGNGQRFSDYLDDFRVYDRALSQSEIRNITGGVGTAEAAYGDVGSVYVWSTDTASQVAKLYVPGARNGDLLGWNIDVDIYTHASVARMGGVIVASSIFNDTSANNGGAVYVWRSTSQQVGAGENNGSNGNGTWRLEATLTAFDAAPNTYFGNDVAIDYDEATGGQRLLVGAPFENADGAYAGAVYAHKFTSGVWVPEKFTELTPQGGSQATASFFGNAVGVADTRAVWGARWRDTSPQVNDGSVYAANLLVDGNYSTVLSAETTAAESFFLPVDAGQLVYIDDSNAEGSVSFDADGKLVYTPAERYKSLGIGETAEDSFVYVTRINNVTYTNLVKVTVKGMEEPMALVNDQVVVSASSPSVIDVLGNDIASEAQPLLTILSVDAAGMPGALSVVDNAVVFDPQGLFDGLRAGEQAQHTFTYSVLDAEGVERTASVTVVVSGEDDPVVAVADRVTTPVGMPVTVDVLANDTDADGHHTIELASLDTSATQGIASISANGQLVYAAGDAFRYLKAGETAEDRVAYIVRDATGNQSVGLLTVTVIGADDTPVARDDGAYAQPGEEVVVDVLANDSDPDGDAIEVTRVLTAGTLGTVTLNADGTVSYRAPAGAVVEDQFSYEIRDALGNVSTATVTINQGGSIPVEVPRYLARDDVAVIQGSEVITGIVTTNDDGAELLSVGAGKYGTFESLGGGALRYTPGESIATLLAGQFVKEEVQYTVRHLDGSIGTATITLYINGTFRPAELQEDDRFVFATATATAAPETAVVAADSSVPDVEAPEADAVARQALDALIEMSQEDAAAANADAVAKAAAKAIEKPALSALLGKEAMTKRAGVDALARHFGNHAA